MFRISLQFPLLSSSEGFTNRCRRACVVHYSCVTGCLVGSKKCFSVFMFINMSKLFGQFPSV